MSDTTKQMLLRVNGLSGGWNSTHLTFKDVSFSLAQGSCLCLVGRSGVGKTTLLQTLAGLLLPQQGTIELMGRPIEGVCGELAYMFQQDLLFEHLRVIDNVCLPLTLAGVKKAQAHARAQAYLERFGLDGLADAWPHELSGGMRQRAAFVRTYLMGKKVLLLDEPFSALDEITREQLRGWFMQTSRELNLSCVMVTHSIAEACLLADTILVLKKQEESDLACVTKCVDVKAAKKELHEGLKLQITNVALREALVQEELVRKIKAAL